MVQQKPKFSPHCFSPLKAFKIGVNPDTGKAIMKVVSYGVDHLELIDTPKGRKIITVDCDTLPSPYMIRRFDDWTRIPCGHCAGCKFEYSKQWANRMVLESLDHESSYFITLTYSDEYLTTHCRREYSSNADNISSVTRINDKSYSYSLNKRDFQLFMKRLRKRFPDQKIRFYACGEYGEKSLRPHYHACIFGLKLPDQDLIPRPRSKHGYPMWNSKILSEVWPFGFVVISNFSWNTAAYVARYVTKKRLAGNEEFYKAFNLEPEFSLMSRRPGLARKYYDEHKDAIYHDGEILLSEAQAGKHMSLRPPKYFNVLFDAEEPIRSAEIKANLKKQMENIELLGLQKTSLSYLEQCKVAEYNFVHKTRVFQRKDI